MKRSTKRRVEVNCWALLLLLGGTIGCGDGEVAESVSETVTEDLHNVSCDLLEKSIPGGDGFGFPGDAGSPRFGLDGEQPPELRVRRSWSTLDTAAKQEVADAFLALKKTIAGSSQPGSERADYVSYCGNYDQNLYDFYVELHASAFVSMMTPDMTHYQMPHMGPHLLPWHRYLLMRLEADLREVSGNPDFVLPYWDWTDCQGDTEDGENPCPKIFEEAYLGSPGSCDDDGVAVTGYMSDQGFERHIWTTAGLNVFTVDGITCSATPLEREVGCSDIGDGKLPTADDVEAIYSRVVYDADPYDSCGTDETVSFRQYLEGFTDTDVNPLCVAGGCQMHGLGHYYVGGDMANGGGSPNDPIFFLHHVNIDRIWALWQDNNRSNPETAADYGNPAFPDDWRGPLFNFDEVRADELFDFRALGYHYDTSTAP